MQRRVGLEFEFEFDFELDFELQFESHKNIKITLSIK